ncbi:MAG: FAD-dependent thymidylate synthase [bacterium]
MKRIIELGHTSTLEHSLITYEVSGISRALLQENSRHRIGVSPSVESTRYTFKRALAGDNIEETLCLSGNDEIDVANRLHMENIKRIVKENNLSNDIAKYGLVEAYKTNLILSFNLRSLMHFYKLRSSKNALKEIQILAKMLVQKLPEEYKQFFEK